MSDSVRRHRRQPTRLPHPWDSPGKNTGVGCHFLLQCMKVKSEREVAQSCPTLSDPIDCSPPGSSVRGILGFQLYVFPNLLRGVSSNLKPSPEGASSRCLCSPGAVWPAACFHCVGSHAALYLYVYMPHFPLRKNFYFVSVSSRKIVIATTELTFPHMWQN